MAARMNTGEGPGPRVPHPHLHSGCRPRPCPAHSWPHSGLGGPEPRPVSRVGRLVLAVPQAWGLLQAPEAGPPCSRRVWCERSGDLTTAIPAGPSPSPETQGGWPLLTRPGPFPALFCPHHFRGPFSRPPLSWEERRGLRGWPGPCNRGLFPEWPWGVAPWVLPQALGETLGEEGLGSPARVGM